MKHFCIVSYCNIYVLPYAQIYINELLKKGAKCTLLFWDRDVGTKEKDDPESLCEIISFQKKVKANSSILIKFVGYLKATKLFRKALKNNNYDGIVFLQAHAAIPFSRVLKRKYRGKYIVDVRDYSFENNRLFRFLEEKTIHNAYRTVISSPAYKQFLPKGEYVVVHNLFLFDNEVVEQIRNKKELDIINISFVGTIRFLEMDYRILDKFKNDYRFQINYYGTGSNILKEYCKKNNINNVDFYDTFHPKMTTEFYKKTSLINNLYGNHDKTLDYAISNKLYHAGQFYIPILVCPETYMASIVVEFKIGYVFDISNPNEPDGLFDWYSHFDRSHLKKGCDMIIEKAREDNNSFYRLLDDFATMKG